LLLGSNFRLFRNFRSGDEYFDGGQMAALSPLVWEVALADGSVAVIVPSDDHARAVIAEGRAVAVYTLDEIARFLSAYPDVAQVKLTFPGAEVTAIRKKHR
jgi:hypothetical protein